MESVEDCNWPWVKMRREDGLMEVTASEYSPERYTGLLVVTTMETVVEETVWMRDVMIEAPM